MRHLFLLIFACLLAGSSQAQVSLHFTQTAYPTIVSNLTDSTVIQDTIYNSSTDSTFHGNIYAYARINDTVISGPPILFDSFLAVNATLVDSPSSGNNRLAFAIAVHFYGPPFVIGPNVVVIWPVYNGGAAGPNDSIRFNVNLYPLGLKESPLANMYLYQTGPWLHIHFGDAENLVQQVRIYDISGRLMYSAAPGQSESIPTGGWQKGVYLCELTTTSGERKVFKFISGD